MTQPYGSGQWPGFQTSQPPTPQPPKKRRKGGYIALGVLVGVAVLTLVGNAVGQNSTVNEPRTVAVHDTRQPTTVAAAPATTAAPRGPQTSFGEGTWIVGVDIAPGTYRSTGAKEGLFEFCSYKRLKEPTSDSDSLSWGTANANEPIVIAIKPTDGAFQSSNCDTFTKVS